MDECLLPWLHGKPICYRPYDCHKDDYGKPVIVPEKRFTIIEGSYSLLPAIAEHADIRVFLHVSPKEQLQRIQLRNGSEQLQVFQQRWIPLEKAYFAAYQLPDEGCVVLSSSDQAT